jgi:hypothetical protein
MLTNPQSSVGTQQSPLIVSAAPSRDQQQFNPMSLDLDTMRQSVSGLASPPIKSSWHAASSSLLPAGMK